MSVWAGWQSDLLKAAGFPNNSANRSFLTAWHSHATSNCARNPVDISKQVAGSTPCKHLDAGRTANNYPSRPAAATAFHDQIFGSEYPFLNAGFFNSSLNEFGVSADVISEIRVWGSAAFADYLQKLASGGGGSGGPGRAPGIHKGWSQVRQAVNTNLPGSLRESNRLTRQALRDLSRARKVKL